MEVAELIPIKTIIDRNYSSYDYPVLQTARRSGITGSSGAPSSSAEDD